MSCWILDIFIDKKLNKNFICPYGKGVMNRPMMDGCGHQYCEGCLKQLLQSNENCIVSNNPIKRPKQLVENLLASKLISNLLIKCINYKEGCKWTDKLKQLQKHLDDNCEFQEVKCVRKLCNSKVIRKNIEEHFKECDYREITCPECEEKIIYINQEKHQEVCPRKEIPCPQHCGQKIKRKNMENHLKNFCKNLEIKCPYHNCDIRGDRKSVQEHVFSKNGFIHHQTLLSDNVNVIENKLKTIVAFTEQLKMQMKAKEIQEQKISDSKEKFDPFFQSEAIFLNKNFRKVMKIQDQEPTFVLLNSIFEVGKSFQLKINCQQNLGIGVSVKDVVVSKNFIFKESTLIDHTYLFRITSSRGRENIFITISMEIDKGNLKSLVLKNQNNQSTTRLFIPKEEKHDLNPVILLSNSGDSAEILQAPDDTQELDFFDDNQKIVYSRNNSMH